MPEAGRVGNLVPDEGFGVGTMRDDVSSREAGFAPTERTPATPFTGRPGSSAGADPAAAGAGSLTGGSAEIRSNTPVATGSSGAGADPPGGPSGRPLVVCVGTPPELFGSVVREVGGDAVVLLAPDPRAAVQVLDGLGGVGRSGSDDGGLATHGETGSAAHDAPADRWASGRPRSGAFQVGPLRLDERIRRVEWRNRPIQLSERQFDLLLTLARDAGRVWTFAELTQTVWQRRYVGDDDAVTSAVKRLRRRLADVSADLLVESVRGVGYRLSLPTGTSPSPSETSSETADAPDAPT